MGLKFRLATETDVWALMALYQRVGSTYTDDPLFLDYERLLTSINATENPWVIGERDGVISTTVSLLLDVDQGLAKVSRIIVNPTLPSVRVDLRDSLRYCISFLQTYPKKFDVLYCTTLTVPMQFQEVTLEEGFKPLGVFPNAMGADSSRLNGLTAFYLNNCLEEMRVKDFPLHPTLYLFFDISRQQLNLPPLPKAEVSTTVDESQFSAIGPLEIVSAPKLVANKFQQLKKRRRQVTEFYPFYRPNLMITSPDEDIQIFAKVIESSRFAALVGEELLVSINPAKLYQNVVQLLKSQNVSYFEIINDAADTVGNQWILDASFVPCGYIPAFKKQNESRRDYVVFCKSFEYVCRPDFNVPKPFLDFFREFFNLEWRNYVGKI